jgi:hypothetical protein
MWTYAYAFRSCVRCWRSTRSKSWRRTRAGRPWCRSTPPSRRSCRQVRVDFFGSATPCASPPPRPSYSFIVHHPVNRDDRHLLARAMASDFTVTWQYSQIEHFFVTDRTPRRRARTYSYGQIQERPLFDLFCLVFCRIWQIVLVYLANILG